MCNINCITWEVKNITKEMFNKKRVLEVGSRDVNGSLKYIIKFLEPAEYIGVDIEEGPSVDVICPAEGLVKKFGKESFDVVISNCAFEHIKDWKRSISNIKNVCKQGGIILFIVPSNWHYHEYPSDFWRYKREDIENIFSDCNILLLEEDSGTPALVYAIIEKPLSFAEKDLSCYQLYSVITNKRIAEFNDKYFKCFYFRRLLFKNKIKNSILKMGKIIFSIF